MGSRADIMMEVNYPATYERMRETLQYKKGDRMELSTYSHQEGCSVYRIAWQLKILVPLQMVTAASKSGTCSGHGQRLVWVCGGPGADGGGGQRPHGRGRLKY